MKVTEKNKEIELDTSGTECPIPVLLKIFLMELL